MSEQLTPRAVQEALRVTVVLDGRPRQLTLAVRTALDVLTDVREPGARSFDDLPYDVLDLIDSIDDDVPTLADAVRICRDEPALETVLGARNRLWSDLRMTGTLLALCPHCGLRESSFSLGTVALVLRAAPPPLFTADGIFLAVPALADPLPPGERFRGIPSATRLGAELPSTVAGLQPAAHRAVLRDLDTTAGDALSLEEAAWRVWAPDGVTPRADHAHRFRARPGFRAILRLSVALAHLDGLDDVTPETVEAMSLADVLFLDACYYLTHNVSQPGPGSLVVTCAHCGGAYLPLR